MYEAKYKKNAFQVFQVPANEQANGWRKKKAQTRNCMLKGNIDCLTLVRHSFYGAPRSRISVADCVVFFFFFAPRLLNYKSFTDVRLPRVFFLAIFFANQQYHSQYWWLRRLHHFTFHIRREYFFFVFSSSDYFQSNGIPAYRIVMALWWYWRAH